MNEISSELISVIVPIYKVEPYLRKCVDSILAQTYRNLEVILVDDGSPDGCPAICDEYATSDARVKVIHKENSGASSARNAGMDVASGDYLMFVDSDDWIDSDYIYDMQKSMQENDWAISGITYVNNLEERSISADGFDLTHLVKSSLFGYSCNKIYKDDLIKNLRFEGVVREDAIFNLKVFAKSQKLAICKNSGYKYLQRNTSQLHSQNANSNEIIIESVKSIYAAVAALNNCDISKMFFSIMTLSITSDHIVSLYNFKSDFKEKYCRIKTLLEAIPGTDLLKYEYCDNFLYKITFFSIVTKNPLFFLIPYMILGR